MTKVDFYNSIKTKPTDHLKSNLLRLFDNLLTKANIQDVEIKSRLARLRAKVDIELRNIFLE